MSPFTADAKVIEKVLGNDGGIWKEMSGTIQSLRIFDRKEATPKDRTSEFTIEIVTDESVVQAGRKSCTGVFRVKTTWDFMKIDSVEVRKLSLG